MLEWDEDKRRKTLEARGIDFAAMEDFDWSLSVTRIDRRRAYGEARYISVGNIGGSLHVAVWTERAGNRRLISLRKANTRERKAYEEAQELHR